MASRVRSARALEGPPDPSTGRSAKPATLKEALIVGDSVLTKLDAKDKSNESEDNNRKD